MRRNVKSLMVDRFVPIDLLEAKASNLTVVPTHTGLRPTDNGRCPLHAKCVSLFFSAGNDRICMAAPQLQPHPSRGLLSTVVASEKSLEM